jgi:hypothetical protein
VDTLVLREQAFEIATKLRLALAEQGRSERNRPLPRDARHQRAAVIRQLIFRGLEHRCEHTLEGSIQVHPAQRGNRPRQGRRT